MQGFGRAGVVPLDSGGPSFAPPTERQLGNNVPGWTGTPGNGQDVPGPHPRTQVMGGNVGHFDGFSGSDEYAAKMQPSPRVIAEGVEQDFHGPPTRVGLIGFNDQLQVRDRHAYWSTGRARNFGVIQVVAGRNPNLDGPPTPTLRTVNVSVNPQIGSDATAFQDDLSRPYTWLGQQDGTRSPIYGGVPGLWQAYGNRGFSDGIHDPSNGEGGPGMVYSGPPHGLHSDTMPSGKQIADRYVATPQNRPVRLDRPSNSTAAGQSYSQTVQMQGQAPRGSQGPRGPGFSFKVSTRGWAGG